MNRSEANRTYSETLEKESRRFERIGGAAASAFTDSSWSAMKGFAGVQRAAAGDHPEQRQRDVRVLARDRGGEVAVGVHRGSD